MCEMCIRDSEKAYRLPTIEEMFGDEDLEMGDISITPERCV